MLTSNSFTFRSVLFALLAFLTVGFTACSDEEDVSGGGSYDPGKSVTITDFIPKEGGVGQKLVVYGDNFGNDTSKVKVTIGGKRAVLINVKNNGLYCFVPEKAFSGEIEVAVGDSTLGVQTAKAAEKFNYQRKEVVSTLCGYRNQFDDQGWHTGPFETCSGFAAFGCMKYDPLYPERLYVVYDNGSPGVQLIDFKKRYVSDTFSKSKFEDKRLRSLDFTLDGKYMIIATDRDDRGLESPSVWIVKRNDDGTFNENSSAQVIGAYKQCNGASIHPVNGELYFNSYENGQVFRLDLQKYFDTINAGGSWNPNVTSNSAFEQLFTIQDINWEFQIDIHPTGKYAYIVVINQHYILRTDYDEVNKRFAPPYVVAGQMKTSGWADGVGTSARLATPYQGVFVKNPEYEAEGKSDVYDFYFAEQANHDVRRLTPEGIVTTFAGRGSRTSAADNNIWGTDNGDLREVARFRDPTGIAYNEAEDKFYVLDSVGRTIREIGLEEDDSEQSEEEKTPDSEGENENAEPADANQ